MMKRQSETGRLIHRAGVLALGLLLIGAMAVAGCVSGGRTVNVSKQAGLAQVSQMEIAELVIEPRADYEHRLTVTDPSILNRLTTALDADLPLGPLAECMAKYRLSFALATGEEQAFDYYCEGGASFLRGAQAFWSEQQVQPPADFDAAMSELLKTLPD
jgi:hypothetical protein